ncbi:thiamine diphosphokinase [Lapidilactobacillus luobeiensis]|uniref:thiamine diphosphokinase n=1 Tax=Lapidilactobacillus luobeiensis TaxID=2950371 RepID=UPI0021C4227B|nr:thiamine diphosphokinase [Lapidilactobacillus luobeiensis]
MIKKIRIMLGGPAAQIPPMTEKELHETEWIGVDHGLIWLFDHGVTPLIGLGDFDSLSPAERLRVEQKVADLRYALPDKDFTDSQWALTTAFSDLKADQVELFGATGGRLDHELVNLFMMTMPAYRQWLGRVTIQDRQNKIRFYGPGDHSLVPDLQYRYLAFVTLTAITDLNLSQVKYPLSHYSVDFPTSWSSNEFLPGTVAKFSFRAGVVAVILARDE